MKEKNLGEVVTCALCCTINVHAISSRERACGGCVMFKSNRNGLLLVLRTDRCEESFAISLGKWVSLLEARVSTHREVSFSISVRERKSERESKCSVER